MRALFQDVFSRILRLHYVVSPFPHYAAIFYIWPYYMAGTKIEKYRLNSNHEKQGFLLSGNVGNVSYLYFILIPAAAGYPMRYGVNQTKKS